MISPQSIAIDPTTGKVFVADTGNYRVLRFASLDSLSNGADAESVLGQSNFTNNGAAVTQSGMQAPTGMVVDGSGRLWVSDYSNNRVLRFDNAVGKADGANADGVLGQTNFTDGGGAAGQNKLSGPLGLAVDSSGRLWVADRFNSRVLRFDNAAAKADGANADGVLGQPDFTNSFQATTQSRMWQPWAVAVDGGGRLWVADYFNRRVLRYDNAAAKADGADADGVLGQSIFTTTNTATTQSGMRGPFGVAIDTIGRLWVNDGNNNRVLRYDNAAGKADGANADGVLGQPDFTSDTPAHIASGLDGPFGLATDSAGNVWVPDSGNNRILLFKDAVQVIITRASSSPTSAASVDFDVAFTSPVTGLSASNFTLTADGVRGAGITNVTGSGAAWTVTVATGNGKGSLRLDMTSSSGVQDGNGNPVTNLPYTSEATYIIVRDYIVALPLIRR
jgi:sugar lactone lactonase YvrE